MPGINWAKYDLSLRCQDFSRLSTSVDTQSFRHGSQSTEIWWFVMIVWGWEWPRQKPTVLLSHEHFHYDVKKFFYSSRTVPFGCKALMSLSRCKCTLLLRIDGSRDISDLVLGEEFGMTKVLSSGVSDLISLCSAWYESTWYERDIIFHVGWYNISALTFPYLFLLPTSRL